MVNWDWAKIMMEQILYKDITDIKAYNIAFTLSNYVWDVVIKWDWFAKDTVGKQYIKAIDSISANLAEGFGRYYKRDKILFYRYSFGSLKESTDWTEKAKVRELLTLEQYQYISMELSILPKEINQFIKLTNEKLKY
jgi:four helix bundle protein